MRTVRGAMTIHLLRNFLFIWGIVCLGWCQSDEDGSLHFSDNQQGRAVWIVDDTSVPWIGSFQYLRSMTLPQTALLTVVDSSTGATLGECTAPNANGSQRWERFQWELNMNGLQCSYSNGNPTRALFPPTANPRTFSVRIQAGRGPACIREMLVQNERPMGCPPHLSRNSFTSMFFNCSCPFADVVDDTEIESTDGTSSETVPQFPLFRGIGEESSVATSTWTLSPSPCAAHDCHNNGTCLVTQEGTATCLCRNGFTGSHCELDLCSSVPCQNGGVCRSTGGTASCECTPGFTGLLCESVAEESVARCNPECSNGQCVERNGIARCECRQGFTGANCNVLDVCLGDAACSMFGSSAKCVLDDSMEKMTSATLINGSYDCRCPHPVHGQYVDCMELHAPKATVPTRPPAPTFPVLEISQVPATATTAMTSFGPSTEEEDGDVRSTTVRTDLSAIIASTNGIPLTAPTAQTAHTFETTTHPWSRIGQGLPTTHGIFPTATTGQRPVTFIFPQTPQTMPTTTENTKIPKFVSPPQPMQSTEEPEPEEIHEMEHFPTPGVMPSHGMPTSEATTIASMVQTIPTTTEAEEYEDHHEEETSDHSAFTTPTTTVSTPTTTTLMETEEPEEVTQATLPFWMTSTTETEELLTTSETTSSEFVEPEEESETEPTSTTTIESTSADIQQKENSKQTSSAASWIIAIIALIVLGLLLLATSLFVLRYIRQSRKLHGKYNPAREEHALSAAYAMPMSHIAKEERLI